MKDTCPHCEFQFDSWQAVRFFGLGIWQGKNDYNTCPNCKKTLTGKTQKQIEKELDANSNSGFYFIKSKWGTSEHHRQLIKSRVTLPNGTVLQGNAGRREQDNRRFEQDRQIKKLRSQGATI